MSHAACVHLGACSDTALPYVLSHRRQQCWCACRRRLPSGVHGSHPSLPSVFFPFYLILFEGLAQQPVGVRQLRSQNAGRPRCHSFANTPALSEFLLPILFLLSFEVSQNSHEPLLEVSALDAVLQPFACVQGAESPWVL